MQTAQYAARLIEALEKLGLPYMLVGSFASNTYGVMRATNDADIVVEFSGAKISDIVRLLGPGFKLDPQSRFESVTNSRQHIITVERSHFALEVFQLSRDPHDLARFARRVKAHSSEMNRDVYLLSPEDVVITKLRWSIALGRHKDVDDARDVMAVQGDMLDWSYIEHWCDEHATRQLLNETRASIPPLP